MPHAAQMSQMRQCIDECLGCYAACMETVNHCLQLGGEHAAQPHIATLIACAEACRSSAAVMLVGSDHHVETCRACAVLCHACAEECERMGDDETMRRCAEECRRCAESCERMAGAAR